MADIRWNYSTKKPSMLYRHLVRRNRKIGKETYRMGRRLGETARAILEPHHRNNDARRTREGGSRSYITVERGASRVDTFVNLKDADGGAPGIEKDLRILRQAKEALY